MSMPNEDKFPPPGTGESISQSGEDTARDEAEPGGVDFGKRGVSQRPSGGGTARKTSSIDPQEPIDDESPNLPGR